MINLFNINHYNINTSKFNHYLHGDIVDEFEENFKNYVGAKYACSINSATNAIFLSLLNKNISVNIPSMIPPVVLNAIVTGGNKINFVDDVDWVGNSYILHKFDDYKIVDSAQKVDKNQFENECNPEDLMIFSFYPTKPVGSSDGGMIVTNDYEKYKWFKEAVLNGMSYSENNWDRKIKFPGYKMYMNSIQCHIANENLKRLEYKKSVLSDIRDTYNKELGYNNTSDHLYRIEVTDNNKFIKEMKSKDIVCGKHYESMHMCNVYSSDKSYDCILSERISKRTVSLPFHEELTELDIDKVIGEVNGFTK